MVNLYLPGCSLKTHYDNISEDKAVYTLEFNGQSTGIKVSVKQALVSDDWDIVTLQQVSSASVKYESYQPYLKQLAEYVKKNSPDSEIFMHQTWSYQEGSKLCIDLGYRKEADMLRDVAASYEKAANDIGAKGIIPSGKVMYALHRRIPLIHRDTFHASFGVGRFALALGWFSYLTGNDISDIKFERFDEPVSKEEYLAAIEAVNEVLGR